MHAHRTATAEHHTNFLVKELGGIKGLDTRIQYELRQLLTSSTLVFLHTFVPGLLLDLLYLWDIGPREIRFVSELYGSLMHGQNADDIRRIGRFQPFWKGPDEQALFEELGLNCWTTPARMWQLNCKVTLRRIAQSLGLGWLVPPHRICRTADEVRAAYRWLIEMESNGIPVPDAVIAKKPRLLSGAGMMFIHSWADLESFIATHVDGQSDVIVEAAWTQRLDASVHWDIKESGCLHAGATVQAVENGLNHLGNFIASAEDDLPGMSALEVRLLYSMTTPIAAYWWHQGYRGMIGFDMIRVVGTCGKERWYMIEPNTYRPPAPRYIMALGKRLDHRLCGKWAIGMSDIHLAPTAVSTFDELVKLLRHPAWGRLLFDGATGIIPLPIGLPHKFIAVCVGRNSLEVQTLLARVKFLAGETVVEPRVLTTV